MVGQYWNPFLPEGGRHHPSPRGRRGCECRAGDNRRGFRQRSGEDWPTGTTVGTCRSPVRRQLVMTEATVIPENAASAQTEETARHGLPESVVEARLGLFLIPRRSPAHAVRIDAHVFPGHEGLVLLLPPDRRRQGKWGGSRAVTSLRTHVRHYFAVEPSHSARGLFQ